MEPTGLIKILKDYYMEGVPASPDWGETLAAMTVGTMMGPHRFAMCKFGKISGSLMSIVISPSGIGHKTVLLNRTYDIFKHIEEKIKENTLKGAGFTEETYKQVRSASYEETSAKVRNTELWRTARQSLDRLEERFEKIILPEQFTSESLITYLTANPNGIVLGDEFTGIYKGSRSKDYLSGFMEMLSRLYDGKLPIVSTVKRGVEDPAEVFVSLASATTQHFLEIVEDSMFLQGTGNRILWIVDTERDTIKNIPETILKDNFFFSIEDSEKHTQKEEEMVDLLLHIHELPESERVPVVLLDYTASMMLDEFRLTCWNKAVNLLKADSLDLEQNFVARLAQNAMKLALVHCVGRYALDENLPQHMDLVEEDATWAISKMEKHLEYYHTLVEMKAELSKTGSTKSYKDDYVRIKKLMIREGGKITANRIRQLTGWRREDCQRLIDDMLANDEIQRSQITGANMRINTYYSLVEQRVGDRIEK